MADKRKTLTTTAGAPVADNQNAMTAGPRGPVLVQDYQLLEKLAAFSPSNIVRGIGFSPDKMLQARVFSYADAHRYRLGTHYEALPVNAPSARSRILISVSRH